MILYVYHFSQRGEMRAEEIALKIKNENVIFRGERVLPVLRERFEEPDFYEADALLFIGAAGIATRKIGHLAEDKTKDPAVLVLDENLQFVIPILSGHIGGANRLAKIMAKLTGAAAVITTATDVNGLFAVDEFAADNGFWISDKSLIKTVSGKLLSEGKITMAVEGISSAGQSDFLEIYGEAPKEIIFVSYPPGGPVDVILSADRADAEKCILHLLNRPVVVGIGCKKDTEPSALEDFFLDALAENDIPLSAVSGIASIDLKKDEPALTELSKAYSLPVKTFTAEQLKGAEGDFPASEFVESVTGVSEVSGRAAKLLGGDGEFVLQKKKKDGMTISIFRRKTLISFYGDSDE